MITPSTTVGAERLTPLTRLFALGAIVQMSLTLNHPLPLAALLAMTVAAGAASGAGRGLRRLSGLLVVLPLFSVILWTVVFPVRGRWTTESALYGLGMGVRLGIMLVAGLAFILVTRPEDLSHALRQLRVPYRVAFAFTLALRLFPLFAEAARTIVVAQRARGIELAAGGLLRRIRRYVPLLVPVLASGLRQADRLSVALDSRGFGAPGPRTSSLEYRPGGADFALIAGLLLMDAGVIWIRASGLGTVW